MHTYVARQPILTRSKETYGHELLFRDGENNAFPVTSNENRASYRVIAENFLSSTPTSTRSFINFTYDAIVQGLPQCLPNDKVVVEIQTNCQPDDRLYAAVSHLHRCGYILALDNFIPDQNEWQRFMRFINIVRLDVLDLGIDAACDYVIDQLDIQAEVSFLAEKIETEEEFNAAHDAGFHYFQGYFFSRPKIDKKKFVTPDQLVALQLITEVAKPDIDYKVIENIIDKDVALSYKLFRFVNILSPRLENPIESFHQALVYLGQDKLKIFVSLAIASYISQDKPSELYTLSIQRARFCQIMAKYQIFKPHSSYLFMIGLFSKIDAILDCPLESLLADIPLSEPVKEALLQKKGILGDLLQMEEYFEYAEWKKLERLCLKRGLDFSDVVLDLYQAQNWLH